jgi:long-subunit acyl-CoA synthetase (AMP-forming)
MKMVSMSGQGRETFEKLQSIGLDIQRNFPGDGQNYVYKNLFKEFHKNLLGEDLEVLISGGAPINLETLKILNSMGFYLVCGFGMTETAIASVELGNDIRKRLSGSLGQPFAYVEYKAIPFNSESLDGTGELYVKGDSLHSGRLKDGNLLPPCLDEDGWMATGDIGAFDSDCALYLRGRIKDIIINESGENVYPDELEEVFNRLPGVIEQCALGIKNNQGYEDITLVLNLGENIENEEVLDELSATLYLFIDRQILDYTVEGC